MENPQNGEHHRSVDSNQSYMSWDDKPFKSTSADATAGMETLACQLSMSTTCFVHQPACLQLRNSRSQKYFLCLLGYSHLNLVVVRLRHAPLQVHSATSCEQLSEWSVLSQVDCFSPWEFVGVQVILNSFHRCNTSSCPCIIERTCVQHTLLTAGSQTG